MIDYIKQLEEANRNLQDKLEESDKKHDDFLDKLVYIYMNDKSQFDNLTFSDTCGVIEGELRIVTTMRYVQKDERMYGSKGSECYWQTWASDGRGGYMWVVTPSHINVNITTESVKSKTRNLKMKYTVDPQNYHNIRAMGLSDIEEDMRKEMEKFTNPIKKPTAKQIKKYGNKKNAK